MKNALLSILFLVIPSIIQAFSANLADIEELIAQDLAQNSDAVRIEVNIFGYDGKQMQEGHELVLESLKIRQSARAFDADIAIYDNDGNKLFAKRFAGRYTEYIHVPAPIYDLRTGDVIEESSIEMIEFPRNMLKKEFVMEPQELENKQARRLLKAGKPISVDHVSNPIIVQKQQIITMIYRHNNIEIRTSGITLDEGAIGDIIRVKNAESGRVVRGTISPQGEVIMGVN